MDDDRPIATIRKNSRQSYTVALRSHHGRRFIDLRIWAGATDREPVPTPVGIAIKPDALRKVIEALEAAEAIAQAEGLIGSSS